MINRYFSADEQKLNDRFKKDGFIIIDVEDLGALQYIQESIVAAVRAELGFNLPENPIEVLNTISHHISAGEINTFRMNIYTKINADPKVSYSYYHTAKSNLESIVGSELAMQRRINLSIQMPDDNSSLLPIHSDVWSGCSPFEIVLWLPLVDCFGTKSMYILPRTIDQKIQERLDQHLEKPIEKLFELIKDDVIWLTVPYGKAVIFSQVLMHGNVVNEETETRWSLNCRFKNLYSPYSDKKLGEYYEPITLRGASAIGLSYKYKSPIHE